MKIFRPPAPSSDSSLYESGMASVFLLSGGCTLYPSDVTEDMLEAIAEFREHRGAMPALDVCTSQGRSHFEIARDVRPRQAEPDARGGRGLAPRQILLPCGADVVEAVRRKAPDECIRVREIASQLELASESLVAGDRGHFEAAA